MTQKQGTIILFTFQSANKSELARFCKKFYGYTDYSNKGKYVYHRDGVITNIPHIKINPIRTAFIVNKDDQSTIVDALETFGAKIIARTIELNPEDMEQLKTFKKSE
jgi:hypothetical protein